MDTAIAFRGIGTVPQAFEPAVSLLAGRKTYFCHLFKPGILFNKKFKENMSLDVKVAIIGSKGSFYIEVENQRLAESTFSIAGDHMIIIDHTDVQDSLRGRGAGNLLIEYAVNWARENSKMILPLCPFANSVFQKTPEYADVWKR